MNPEGDGINLDHAEAAEAADPTVGTGTPETAPHEELEFDAEVEHVVEGERPETVDPADGAADDDDAIDVPDAEAADSAEDSL